MKCHGHPVTLQRNYQTYSVKVLFIARATLYKDSGGDTVQVLNTADALRKSGITVEIVLTTDTIDYAKFDLLHFFNIIRPADILFHISKANKPFVVSTIYVDYSEFEKKNRKGITGLAFRLLGRDMIEYLKVIARLVVNNEKIMSHQYLFYGHRRSVRKIIAASDMLLPNSQSEYNRLSKDYAIFGSYRVIPNAIEPSLFVTDGRIKRDDNLVICVGRIEGRKNQLNLIKALNNSRFKLILIGAASANQVKYYQACKAIAAPNVSFINKISQVELKSYYQEAKVHVLPSWFETTGLSSLEAAVMGCNVVITEKGDTREYFEDYAYYCDPNEPKSILSAVLTASSQPYNEKLYSKIVNNFTWKQTAEKTLEAYKTIIGH